MSKHYAGHSKRILFLANVIHSVASLICLILWDILAHAKSYFIKVISIRKLIHLGIAPSLSCPDYCRHIEFSRNLITLRQFSVSHTESITISLKSPYRIMLLFIYKLVVLCMGYYRSDWCWGCWLDVQSAVHARVFRGRPFCHLSWLPGRGRYKGTSLNAVR